MVWQALVISLLAAQQPTNQAEILRQGQDLVPPYIPAPRQDYAPTPPSAAAQEVDRVELAKEMQREAYAVATQCLEYDAMDKRRDVQRAFRMTEAQYLAFLRDCMVVQWAIALSSQRANAQK